jgi:hypothetical protein
MELTLIDEFELDWHLTGKSKETAKKYAYDIKKFIAAHPNPNLIDAKQWILGTSSMVSRRKRGQA